MTEVPVQDLFESASHKVTPACHNLWVHSQSKCVQIQSRFKVWKSRVSQCVPTTQKKYMGV